MKLQLIILVVLLASACRKDHPARPLVYGDSYGMTVTPHSKLVRPSLSFDVNGDGANDLQLEVLAGPKTRTTINLNCLHTDISIEASAGHDTTFINHRDVIPSPDRKEKMHIKTFTCIRMSAADSVWAVSGVTHDLVYRSAAEKINPQALFHSGSFVLKEDDFTQLNSSTMVNDTLVGQVWADVRNCNNEMSPEGPAYLGFSHGRRFGWIKIELVAGGQDVRLIETAISR